MYKKKIIDVKHIDIKDVQGVSINENRYAKNICVHCVKNILIHAKN